MNMLNDNVVKVYGQGRYGHRQTYKDNKGIKFVGTLKEARTHFGKLYPSMNIQMSHSPKKRESR